MKAKSDIKTQNEKNLFCTLGGLPPPASYALYAKDLKCIRKNTLYFVSAALVFELSFLRDWHTESFSE